jgi:hypothetical protein
MNIMNKLTCPIVQSVMRLDHASRKPIETALKHDKLNWGTSTSQTFIQLEHSTAKVHTGI